MNVLITGVSGSGKTTIASKLIERGYYARNMDSIEGLCSWVDLATGKSEPNFKRESAADWEGKYDWFWDETKLGQLAKETNQTFFCGSSGNQEKFYHLFDKLFLLEMDEQLIKDRVLNSERDHSYGRMPGEIEAILGYYEDFQNSAIAAGAVVIDAQKSINEIISLIINS